MELIKHMESSTLDELRSLVDATTDLPGTSRSVSGRGSSGQRPTALRSTRIHIGEVKRTGAGQ